MRARKLLGDYRQQKVSFAEQGADLIGITFSQLIFPDWAFGCTKKSRCTLFIMHLCLDRFFEDVMVLCAPCFQAIHTPKRVCR